MLQADSSCMPVEGCCSPKVLSSPFLRWKHECPRHQQQHFKFRSSHSCLCGAVPGARAGQRSHCTVNTVFGPELHQYFIRLLQFCLAAVHCRCGQHGHLCPEGSVLSSKTLSSFAFSTTHHRAALGLNEWRRSHY